jgi:hypothetical protein
VDCQTPEYDSFPLAAEQAFRAKVKIGHVNGTPDARYLIDALRSQLQLYVQLNVYRLVLVYRIPAQ